MTSPWFWVGGEPLRPAEGDDPAAAVLRAGGGPGPDRRGGRRPDGRRGRPHVGRAGPVVSCPPGRDFVGWYSPDSFRPTLLEREAVSDGPADQSARPRGRARRGVRGPRTGAARGAPGRRRGDPRRPRQLPAVQPD